MGFKCGIVGLPNVGKSTLFNALTQTAAAEAANYPFCTIEPNTGRVNVPDLRLDEAHRRSKAREAKPTQIEIVDIAGLVRGASRGEGLGNQFLANIREVDAIIHIVRCFEDASVAHAEAGVDPVRDAEIVETELMLADLESLERRLEPLTKRARGGDREARLRLAVIEPVAAALAEGCPARAVAVPAEHAKAFRELQLLTAKPVLYACNVDEASAGTGNVHSRRVADMAAGRGAEIVVVSAKIEAEIAQLAAEDERREFLATLGLAETGLSQVIRAGYRLLGLITFFTTGPKETRAWTVRKGAAAPEAAGVIHSDFQRGFICAETISYDDYVAFGGEQGARDAGRMRQEGRDYRVADGDVILFRFNV
jgi:ribosome-binding ATPase